MPEETNRFAPPHSKVSDPELVHELAHAGKGRRFGTFIIDNICIVLFGMAFAVIIALLFGRAGVAAYRSVPSLLSGYALSFVFYVFFEALWGRTPGKLVFGTIAVSESGGRLAAGLAVKRTLCRFIPFEPLSFSGDRGWHDRISRTHVVLARKS